MRRSLGRGLSQLLSQTSVAPPAPAKPTPKKTSAVATPKPKSTEIPKPKPTRTPAAKAPVHTNGAAVVIPEIVEPPIALAVSTPLAPTPQPKVEPGSMFVPVEEIRPNSRQPRVHFNEEALRELSASIKEVGVLQPLIVRELGGGHYELIAGERRLRAAKQAGLETVPVVIRKESHKGSLEIALIENLQREDIGALEAARAYQRLLDEFGMTQEQVAQRVGKSRPAVANSVRLLKLPERVKDGLESGEISEGHARALLAVDDPTLQLALYEKIIAKKLSVRESEDLVRPGAPTKASGPKSRRPQLDPSWEAVRSSISERIGSPVKLQRDGNRGKIVIDFYSDDDLERILETLGIRI